MNLAVGASSISDLGFAGVADAIAEQGYIVLPNALPLEQLDQLRAGLIALDPDQFATAGIGRDQEFQRNQFVRKDKIHWLDEDMVIFLSEVFPHEVVQAQRSRFSLTGWFRINDFLPAT